MAVLSSQTSMIILKYRAKLEEGSFEGKKDSFCETLLAKWRPCSAQRFIAIELILIYVCGYICKQGFTMMAVQWIRANVKPGTEQGTQREGCFQYRETEDSHGETIMWPWRQRWERCRCKPSRTVRTAWGRLSLLPQRESSPQNLAPGPVTSWLWENRFLQF